MAPKTLVIGQEGTPAKPGFSGKESADIIIFGGYADDRFTRAESVLIAFSNAIDDQFNRNDSVVLAFPVFQEETRLMVEDEKIGATSMPADAPSRTEAVVITNH